MLDKLLGGGGAGGLLGGRAGGLLGGLPTPDKLLGGMLGGLPGGDLLQGLLSGDPTKVLGMLQKMLGGGDPSKMSDEQKQGIAKACEGQNLSDPIKQLLGQLGIPGFVSAASGAGASRDSFQKGGSLLDPLGIKKSLGLPGPEQLLGGGGPLAQLAKLGIGIPLKV